MLGSLTDVFVGLDSDWSGGILLQDFVTLDLGHLKTSMYGPCHFPDLRDVWAASPRPGGFGVSLASVLSSSPEVFLVLSQSLSYAQRESSLLKWKTAFARDMVSVCSKEVYMSQLFPVFCASLR